MIISIEMRVLSVMSFIVFFLSSGVYAQKDDPHDHDRHHDHHSHEIGLANTLVYFLGEEEFAYGLHVHYLYRIKETKFSVGLGYERIFDEHGHNTLGPVASFMPVDRFSISFLPGIGFEDHEPSKIHVALHLEMLYEFELGNFHIGPTVGFGYEPEDMHIGAGVHVGYGF